MDLKMDTNNDLDVTAGAVSLVDGVEYVAQNCEIRLKFFLGEWFLDQRLGVPWFQRILGQKPRLNAVSEILQSAALTTPGLDAINEWELDYDGATRALSISFTGQAGDEPFDFTTELIVSSSGTEEVTTP
jgi:hypothetical protein